VCFRLTLGGRNFLRLVNRWGSPRPPNEQQITSDSVIAIHLSTPSTDETVSTETVFVAQTNMEPNDGSPVFEQTFDVTHQLYSNGDGDGDRDASSLNDALLVFSVFDTTEGDLSETERAGSVSVSLLDFVDEKATEQRRYPLFNEVNEKYNAALQRHKAAVVLSAAMLPAGQSSNASTDGSNIVTTTAQSNGDTIPSSPLKSSSSSSSLSSSSSITTSPNSLTSYLSPGTKAAMSKYSQSPLSPSSSSPLPMPSPSPRASSRHREPPPSSPTNSNANDDSDDSLRLPSSSDSPMDAQRSLARASSARNKQRALIRQQRRQRRGSKTVRFDEVLHEHSDNDGGGNNGGGGGGDANVQSPTTPSYSRSTQSSATKRTDGALKSALKTTPASRRAKSKSGMTFATTPPPRGALEPPSLSEVAAPPK
jgi:hypothetical protein